MALSDVLAHPNVRKVFLLTLTARERLEHWTDNGDGTHTASSAYRVTAVYVDGASVSHTWDSGAGTVTITHADPYTVTVQAEVTFYVSNTPKRFSGVLYDPRILEAPDLSLRVGDYFGDLGQIGGGTLTVANNDAWADDLADLDWDAGTAVLRLGADRPQVGETMPLADYEVQGTWFVERWEVGLEEAELHFKEIKERSNVEIPRVAFKQLADADDEKVGVDYFPNLDPNAEGALQPIVYGTVYQAQAYCIDTTVPRFCVAGHAVTAIQNCRVNGTAAAMTNISLSAATFDLASWDGDATVTVDVLNTTLTKPVDVIEDLLTTWGGEAAGDLNSAAFTAASAAAALGTYRDGSTASVYEVSLYVDDATDLHDLVEEVAALAGLLVWVDADGAYTVHTWAPQPSEGATALVPADLFDVREVSDSAEVVTRVLARYRHREQAGASQVVEVEDDAARVRRARPAHLLHEADLRTSLRRSAQEYASRTLAHRGDPLRLWELEVSHRAFSLAPGDPVQITGHRILDGLYEVHEVVKDLGSANVQLVVSWWRGMEDRAGFWVGDSPTFPARLGGASCATWSSSWTATQQQWARENVGYWTDDDGYAASGDAASRLGSAWV